MIDSIDRAARILVVYYSATGHGHALAKAVAEGAAASSLRCALLVAPPWMESLADSP